MSRISLPMLLALVVASTGPGVLFAKASEAPVSQPSYLSPTALAAAPDGRRLFIACATAGQVIVFDMIAQQVLERIYVPESPLGLTLSQDGKQLFVTCAAPVSTICVIETDSLKVRTKIHTNFHTTMAPACSPDGAVLYVCNRFNNSVSVIDLDTRKEISRIQVPREPVAASLTPDGKFLFVANHLHAGRADEDTVSACVTVIDTAARKCVKNIQLPSGSTTVRDVCISPDGKWASVTFVIGQFHLPTTQIERGWIVNNALGLIDVTRQEMLDTVLLDNIDSGAANPWAAAWSTDGRRICVTHAGTHELSVIDVPGLFRKLQERKAAGSVATNYVVPAANDLTFLAGLRQRVKLDQRGPRPVAVSGGRAYVGNYFSDSLSVVDLDTPGMLARSIPLGPRQEFSIIRKGELFFNDASLCFQGWLSCGSCHSSDARVDGLNWDLLNDGFGNPKNARSLLFAHRTAPNMSLGVRENAQLAVRAGFRYILFNVPDEEIAAAVDHYLESLKPILSPYLQRGKFSPAAIRGKKLFADPKVGCAECHPSDLFTDLKPYDVGTAGKFDKPGDKFFSPALLEAWRTAPYLHDGSAATMRDVLTTSNRNDLHGKTSHLTKDQIEDLAAYLLSL